MEYLEKNNFLIKSEDSRYFFSKKYCITQEEIFDQIFKNIIKIIF